jgi:hypothetical protein
MRKRRSACEILGADLMRRGIGIYRSIILKYIIEKYTVKCGLYIRSIIGLCETVMNSQFG